MKYDVLNTSIRQVERYVKINLWEIVKDTVLLQIFLL